MTKYEIIQNDIADKIHRGIYRENDKLPSEHTLMKEWGVSRITVTKALTELTLAGYIYRVQGKGSFVSPFYRHLSPRSHTANRSASPILKKAAVIMPGYAAPHGAFLLDGILDTLTFPEYFVSTFFVKSRDAENAALEHCKRSGYSGIILFPTDTEFYSEVILEMSLMHYPIVLVDRKFPGINVPSVTTDNRFGSAEAVERLTSLGHTKIAYAAYADVNEQVSALRFEGYRDAMLQKGLGVHPFFNLNKVICELIAKIKSGDITAVLACNSRAASLVYNRCISEGVDIPHDLSIICFDNPTPHDINMTRFFTYIDQNSYKMGRCAAQILKDFADGKTPEDQVLTPQLIINESAGLYKSALK